jgi:hypothetical protein
MKKMLLSLTLVFLCTAGFTSSNSLTLPTSGSSINATQVYVPIGKTGHMISLMDLSQISVKDFEKLSGEKMKFFDKVKFKAGQHELRKNINEDGSFNSKKLENYVAASQRGLLTGGISWAGLALGIFLSLIGVLIAYLIVGKEGNKSMIKWAWIGAIISVIIWGAVLI